MAAKDFVQITLLINEIRIKSFYATAVFLYHLRTTEKKTCSGGIEMEHQREIRQACLHSFFFL